MDQVKIGEFIALKRKEQQLTQEQLANKLGVSNKSVSKWETGKNMPDLSLHKELCKILNISISELLEGQEMKEATPSDYDKKILELLQKNEQTKNQKNLLIGLMLLLIGRIPIPITSNTSPAGEFIQGLGYGISTAITLLGIFICTVYLVKMNQTK